MKSKKIFLTLLIVALSVKLFAQSPVATLEHSGTTTVFNGQNSFVDAYNASANGDQIYLSTGFFNPPPSIAKGIKIIGAGHFPDSANVARRTTILSGLTINAGADSLRLEGMYINGDINYQGDASINYVMVTRCGLGNALFNSSSASSSKNNCSYEECFIRGFINFNYFGTNLLIYHSIIMSSYCYITNHFLMSIVNINGSALIDGNIFVYNNDPAVPIGNVVSSLIRNNIFLSNYGTFAGENNSNKLYNNLFVKTSIDFGNNTYSNNYTGVPQADIFINQTGYTIDYTHDYHLKNPELYLGTDGTQVGIYGGTIPFKEKGLPSNPQITSKSIAPETDANGNLQISFTVKAQER